MKKNLLLICFALISCSIQLYSQPTREMVDFYQGSSVLFNNLSEVGFHNKLYIDKWTVLKSEPDNSLYLLKEYNNQVDSIMLSSIISVNRSEFNDRNKIATFIYEDKVMVIKVIKNKPKLRITINNLYFKEGIFRIDLNQLYEKYKTEDIKIESFPTEEDLDLSGDRIVDISYFRR